VKETLAKINVSDRSDWTKYGYRSSMKKFFRVIGKEDIIEWIKLRPGKIKKEYNILTRKEIERMIASAKTLRDKAFVAVLYGTGCRIGEIADLKTSDIDWDEHGCIIHVKGKTGFRPVRLVGYSMYLEVYLKHRSSTSTSERPQRDLNPHIWLAEDNFWKGKPMSVKALRRLLKRLKAKARINKPVNPHNFRHSRATYFSNFLTDQQMRIFFGWAKGSKMPSLYSHLSHKDVDEKIIRISSPAQLSRHSPERNEQTQDENQSRLPEFQ